jgi:AmmeMemoRadiSam system protein A
MQLTDNDKSTLLKLARQSIQLGLNRQRLRINLNDYSSTLKTEAACFVTLTINHQLRGCIGHLSAVQPLVQDVADNAFAAAFSDPRFTPLSASELERVNIEISILTPATPMTFSSEADLLDQIVEGEDGLILEDRGHRGTFLPSVWESLPTRDQFWQHLKMKAGLPVNYWSESLQVSRYRTLAFSE